MSSFSSLTVGFTTDKRVTFGGVKTKSYVAWKNMIHRCYNENNKDYKYYGEKGITICDEWKLFSNFEKWYDENYIEGYEMDKDFGGRKVYSPDSCKFVSKEDNIAEKNSRVKGCKHPKSKDYLFYSSKPTSRGNFKIACERQGWNFSDFEEIRTTSKTSSGAYKFVYVAKEVF